MQIDSHRHFRRHDAVRDSWIADAALLRDGFCRGISRLCEFGSRAARGGAVENFRRDRRVFYGLKVRHGLTTQR
jgi:hypothetical protein